MTGGLMQLVAYGAQDIYLTGNPMITFFKTVYRRHTNFAMESIQQTLNGTVGFGSTVRATISRNGDLISNAYLKVTLPNVTDLEANPAPVGGATATSRTQGTRWVSSVGHYLVNRVDIEIGGQLIDRHYGDWLEIWSQLTVPVSKLEMYKRMVGDGNELQQLTVGAAKSPTAQMSDDYRPVLHVPLQFWFCRNIGLALPLIALQYHEVNITLVIESQDNLVFGVDSNRAVAPVETVASATVTGTLGVELWVDYIYLDTDERRRFAQVSHEYLIEQLQFAGNEQFNGTAAGNFVTQNINLNFDHPVKELVWVSRMAASESRKQWNNYTDLTHAHDDPVSFPFGDRAKPTGTGVGAAYAQTVSQNLTRRALLQLNGHNRFAARSGDYFNSVQTYEHHDGHVRSPGINVYSFALKPADHQPSGTCNFSRIDNARLTLTLSRDAATSARNNANALVSTSVAASGFTKVFATNYNVLRIMSGMGGLAYSN